MNLESPCRPAPLVDAIAGFLTHVHVSDVAEIRAAIERVIDDAGPGALERLRGHLESAGADWGYSPKDDLAQRLHHVLASRILREPPVLLGRAHLDAIASDPVVIFANHLSYVDANALEVTFELAGYRDLANRLVAVAGPKVYSDLKRRFSSLCFGTIKVPQSGGRASGDAVMTTREVALAARHSIETARECLARGQALLVFPEGTRSRSGGMEPFLSGVARYLDAATAWVLPIGLSGTETLFPMGEASFNPVRVTVHVGQPVRAEALLHRAAGDRHLLMDTIGYAVSGLLPEAYRGVYCDEAHRCADARRLANELFTCLT